MKGAAARRERNRQEMHQAILNVAAKQVHDSGVDGVTIRGIARELGYSPGAIYEYFDSKEQIVHSLYYEGSGGLAVTMLECCRELGKDDDVFQALRQLANAYRQHAQTHAEMYRLVFGVLKQPKHMEEHIDVPTPGGLGTLVSVVQRGIEAGDLIPVPASVIAVALWTAVHGFVSLELTDHFTFVHETGLAELSSEHAIDDLFASTIAGLLRGWATPEGLTRLNS